MTRHELSHRPAPLVFVQKITCRYHVRTRDDMKFAERGGKEVVGGAHVFPGRCENTYDKAEAVSDIGVERLKAL
jgi:hypothetical protein